MASYDGSINIDARLNIKNAVINSKDLGKAIESLKSTVDTFGKDAAQSTNAYVNVLSKASTALSDVGSAFSGIENGAQQMIGALSDTSLINKSWEDLKTEMSDLQAELEAFKAAGLTSDDWQFAEVEERLRDVSNAVDAKAFSMATESIRTDIDMLMQQFELLSLAEGVDPYLFQEIAESIKPILDQITMMTNRYEGLKAASQSTGHAMSDSMDGATQSIQGFRGELEEIESAESNVQSGTYEMAQNIEEGATGSTEAMEAASDSAVSTTDSLNRAATAAARFARRIASGALKMAVSTIKSVGSAAINAAKNLARMAGSGILSFLRRLAQGAKNAAVQLTKMVGSAVANGIKKLSSLAGKATKSLLGLNKASRGDGFKEGLKFLVRYGFGVRSLFMLYRKLRGAVVEAFENMAKKVPEVNKSLSRLASSFDLLKNSLATAFQPILTAVTPYLVQLMDMMSEAAAKVGEFFAVLTGQNYIYKATKANIDYAKSLDKSTKSTKKNTKETENQLASFDHLNILKENKDSDSSSDKEETPTADFSKVPIESAISELAKRIKDAFNRGDFTEIGKILANKLTEWVNEIDWGALGIKIGKGINHIVDVVNGFFDNFDWVDLGQKFAEGLNSLIDNVNFYELGRAMTQKLRALIETAWGVVSDINWEHVGDAIGNYIQGVFDNIPWGTLGTLLGTSITGVFQSIFTAAETFEWGKAGAKLDEGFSNLINSIDIDTIYDALWITVIGILDLIGYILMDVETWGKIASDFATFMNNLFQDDGIWNKLRLALIGGVATAIASLKTFVSKFEWGKNGQMFHNQIMTLIDEFPLNELGTALSELLLGSLTFLKDAFGDEELLGTLGTKLGEFLDTIFNNEETWDTAGQTANNMMKGILAFGENFLAEFKPEDAANNIKKALGEIQWGEIAYRVWFLFKDALGKAGSFVDALFSDSTEGLSGEALENAEAFNAQPIGVRIAEKLKDVFADKTLFDDVARTVWEGLQTAFTTAGDFVSALLGVTEKDVQSADNSRALAIGKKIGQMIADGIGDIKWENFSAVLSQAVSDLFDALNGFFQSIAIDKVVRTDDGRAISKLQDAIERFFGGIDWGGVATSIVQGAWNAFLGIGESLLGAIIQGLDGNSKPITVDDMSSDPLIGGGGSYFTQTGQEWADGLTDASINEFGVKQPEIESAIVKAHGVGRKDLLEEKGKEATDSVVDGTVTEYDVRKPDIEDAAVKAHGVGRKDLLEEKGKETTDSVIDGSVNEFDARKKEVGDAMTATFMNQYETNVAGPAGFDMGSPSRRTEKDGKHVVEGFVNGVDSEKGSLESSFDGIVNTVDSKWNEAENKQNESLSSMANALSTTMSGMTNTSNQETENQAKPVYDKYGEIMLAVEECMRAARDYMKQYSGNMVTTMQTDMNNIANTASYGMSNLERTISDSFNRIGSMNWAYIGQNICNGIAQGINNGWNWLNNTVWNLANSLFQSAKNALGIASPSKVFRDQVGYMVGAGLAEGLDDSQHEVLGSITDMAKAMVDEMQNTDLTADVGVNDNTMLNSITGALSTFSIKIEDSFITLTERLQAIADKVTFITPNIAAGTVLPYAIQGDLNVNTDNVAVALEKNNEELINIMIQLVNNQTSAIVAGLERYCKTNVNIDKKSLTDLVVEEINRRTRAMGASPLLI